MEHAPLESTVILMERQRSNPVAIDDFHHEGENKIWENRGGWCRRQAVLPFERSAISVIDSDDESSDEGLNEENATMESLI